MGKRSFSIPRLVSAFPLFLLVVLCITAVPCFADVASSLNGIRNALTGIILPTLSVIGIAIAAFSFFTGNPRAKEHIVYAILGCVFGFGAQAIVNLIRSAVN